MKGAPAAAAAPLKWHTAMCICTSVATAPVKALLSSVRFRLYLSPLKLGPAICDYTISDGIHASSQSLQGHVYSNRRVVIGD